jgi:hypothetical protein
VDTLRLYDSPGLPTAWVVENETTGQWFIVPARNQGWAHRSPYRGHREGLRSVRGYNWISLGAPLRRPLHEVCHDESGRN